ncbi:MAG: lysylphosphatidylglycerol synthase transmembrane domain-containing protein [Pseudomonadota bacterium]
MLGFKIVICLGIMAWILSRADLGAVFAVMGGADPRLLALALAMQIVGGALITLRWRALLAVKHVAPGFAYLFQSTVSSFFFRQFLPTVVGGDTIRGYDAWRAGADPGFAVFSLVVDRLFGLMALVLFALLAGVALDRIAVSLPGLQLWSVVALTALLILLAIVAVPRRIPTPRWTPTKLTQLIAAMQVFSTAPLVLLRCFILSVVLQINVVTFYWVIAQSLGLTVPYTAFFAIVPVAIFAMMAPISINGIGVREAVFILLLGLWGIEKSHALAFAWLEFGLVLTTGLVGGAVYALRRERPFTRSPQAGAD